MPAQRLNSLDSSFLHLETRNTHMHIGGIAIFEAGPWTNHEERYKALVRHVEPRLDLMPRYRQKIAFLPMNVDLPVWQDDESFDIKFSFLAAFALPGKYDPDPGPMVGGAPAESQPAGTGASSSSPTPTPK